MIRAVRGEGLASDLTMAATPTTPLHAGKKADPFPYGWRYVQHTLPDGSVRFEQVPLTLEDVLHPQGGDQTPKSLLQQEICAYLFDIFNWRATAKPNGVVLRGVRVAWDVPDLKPHG